MGALSDSSENFEVIDGDVSIPCDSVSDGSEDGSDGSCGTPVVGSDGAPRSSVVASKMSCDSSDEPRSAYASFLPGSRRDLYSRRLSPGGAGVMLRVSAAVVCDRAFRYHLLIDGPVVKMGDPRSWRLVRGSP